jgi:dihydroorotase
VLGSALGISAKDAGHLRVGAAADVCVFDPNVSWVLEPAALRSQGHHTPFAGYELPGRVRATLVAGRLAYAA